MGLLSFFWVAQNIAFYNTSRNKMPLRIGINTAGITTVCRNKKYDQFISFERMVSVTKIKIPKGSYNLVYYSDNQKKRKEPLGISPEVYEKIVLNIPRIRQE
jgi:hypothetical protein